MLLDMICRALTAVAAFIILYASIQVSVHAAMAIAQNDRKTMVKDFALLAVLYFALATFILEWRN